MDTLITILPPTALVAGVALLISVLLARSQRRERRYERAHALLSTLSTKTAVDDRHLLGTYHWRNKPITKGEVRDAVMRAYFSMLWLFSDIQNGRASLLATNKNKRDEAIEYLDKGLITVVLEYVCTFYTIKAKMIEADPNEEVFEGSYGDHFSELCAGLAEGVSDDTTRRMLLRVHVNNTEQCLCGCHTVRPQRTVRRAAAA
ncbi:hypothetical protein [Streptomyces anulatus]|uniref:hypothetical protein n=1 Tax=Streptomyces anulatus TaxID=1892 RepID=UPI0012FF266D|nr:hypothetical protein [Streptomyces anulatus]